MVTALRPNGPALSVGGRGDRDHRSPRGPPDVSSRIPDAVAVVPAALAEGLGWCADSGVSPEVGDGVPRASP